MLRYKKIKVGKSYIEALAVNLLTKNLILLRGRKGYIMCGYLNLKVAQKFNDVAVKVIGVSSIEEILKASVYSCTPAAKKTGISKGQSIKEVLKIIA